MERMKIAAVLPTAMLGGKRDHRLRLGTHHPRHVKILGFIEIRTDAALAKNLQVVMSGRGLANYKEIAAQNVGRGADRSRHVVLTPTPSSRWAEGPHHRGGGQVHPDYPCRRSATAWNPLRTIQHLRPRTNPILRHLPCPLRGGRWRCTSSSRATACLCPDPIITGSDCEGASARCLCDDAGSEQRTQTEDGQVDYSQDFFGKKTSLTVSGQ